MITRQQVNRSRRWIENQKLAEQKAVTLSGREKANMQLLAIYSNLMATEEVKHVQTS
jgi:hypothetical protein